MMKNKFLLTSGVIVCLLVLGLNLQYAMNGYGYSLAGVFASNSSDSDSGGDDSSGNGENDSSEEKGKKESLKLLNILMMELH